MWSNSNCVRYLLKYRTLGVSDALDIVQRGAILKFLLQSASVSSVIAT